MYKNIKSVNASSATPTQVTSHINEGSAKKSPPFEIKMIGSLMDEISPPTDVESLVDIFIILDQYGFFLDPVNVNEFPDYSKAIDVSIFFFSFFFFYRK